MASDTKLKMHFAKQTTKRKNVNTIRKPCNLSTHFRVFGRKRLYYMKKVGLKDEERERLIAVKV